MPWSLSDLFTISPLIWEDEPNGSNLIFLRKKPSPMSTRPVFSTCVFGSSWCSAGAAACFTSSCVSWCSAGAAACFASSCVSWCPVGATACLSSSCLPCSVTACTKTPDSSLLSLEFNSLIPLTRDSSGDVCFWRLSFIDRMSSSCFSSLLPSLLMTLFCSSIACINVSNGLFAVLYIFSSTAVLTS